MSLKLRNWRVWVLVGAATWFTTVIVLIATRPAAGAASAEDLAARVADALRTENVEDLAAVVSFDEGGDEVAEATIENFAAAAVRDVRTHPEQYWGRTHVVVEYVRGDGTSGVLRLPAVKTSGAWKLTPVAMP